VTTELVMVPDDGHIGTFMHTETLTKAYAFLDGHLRPAAAPSEAVKPLSATGGSR
jgi:hypothetical protein